MSLVKHTRYLSFCLVWVVLFFSACESDAPEPITVIYKVDGRTVKQGDPRPISVDISGDGQVDFTIFVELTANSAGDRLYTGVNPVGTSLIKSGPANDENFLNMGMLVAESTGSSIDSKVEATQQWTSEHSTLVIRNTFTDGKITYEGDWASGEQIVGIQNIVNGSTHFGWLRIDFNKQTEIVTLVDYAYESIANKPIKAGAN